MNTPQVWAAWIGGAFLLAGSILSAFIALLKHRLDLRQLRHDETRWLLELQSDLERKLLDARLETYPEIIRGLQHLSHHPPRQRSREEWLALADQVNNWGYSNAALVMLPDTRNTVFKLREALQNVADGEMSPEAMMAGVRTDVIELMQRDLSLTESVWRRELPSLMAIIAKAVDVAQPKRSWWERIFFG